ncbi:MAG: pyridoxamine 5'-phosphate oxidase family protein [Candidatus Hydrothermarchaeales archaeon]
MIPHEVEKLFTEIKDPIVFATGDGTPHATPMNWQYTGNGSIWISPAGGTKKIKNILKNKNVCCANLEGMNKGSRGFILWGEIEEMETGLWALLKNFRVLKKTLNEKSNINLDFRTLKMLWVYHNDPSIYYSVFPWDRYFLKVKINRVKYWDGKGVKGEIELKTP